MENHCRPFLGFTFAVLFVLFYFFAGFSLASVTSRAREPIVISVDSSLFPDWVDQGIPAQVFELWTNKNSQWKALPFQIDQFKSNPRKLASYLTPCGPGCVCRAASNINPDWRGPCEKEYYLRGTALPGQSFSSGDELVFMAGDAGACDVPKNDWPDGNLALTRQRITIQDGTDWGCVYLFWRAAGMHPATLDLVSYDEAGDGISHPPSCQPSSSACGALIGRGYDFSGDGTVDSPSYRLDFLGNWAADKLFIARQEAQNPPTDSLIDLLKYRIDSPQENEGVWDIRNNAGVCAVFHGFIDGPVRVIRVIQGAASGATTTKYEFAYPSEIRFRVNLRVHNVNGPIYNYADLNQANLAGNPATTVYKASSLSGYDFVDGIQPTNKTFGSTDWFQVSSTKGSFVSIPGLQIAPTARLPLSGAYDDTTTPLWTSTIVPEYDTETGDRAAARPGIITCLCNSQDINRCRSQDEDQFLAVFERTIVMLKAGFSSSQEGDTEVKNRARGVFSVTVEKQIMEPIPLPQPTPPPCIPVLTPSYSNDGGDVFLSVGLPGCPGANGWNLYFSTGAGKYSRLASLGRGMVFRDKTLGLNESRTYFAKARGIGGAESPFSSGVTVIKADLVPPNPPLEVSATAQPGVIELTWAQPTDWDVRRHQILASTSPGGPYNIAAITSDCDCPANIVFSAAGPSTYYLRVVAIDQAGNQSLPSEEVQVDVP